MIIFTDIGSYHYIQELQHSLVTQLKKSVQLPKLHKANVTLYLDFVPYKTIDT